MDWLSLVGSLAGGGATPAGPAVSGSGPISFGSPGANNSSSAAAVTDYTTIAVVAVIGLALLVVLKKAGR